MNEFQLALSCLEDKLVSRQVRERLIEKCTASGFMSEYYFELFLHDRMVHNISPENLLNIGQNIFAHQEIRRTLSEKFVDVLSSEYLKGHFDDYFIYIARQHDEMYRDISLTLLHRTAYHISHGYGHQDALRLCKEIASEVGIRLAPLLCLLSSFYYKEGASVKVLMLIDLLSLDEKYDLMVESCRSHNTIFHAISDDLGNDINFSSHVIARLNDDGEFCRALRSISFMRTGSLGVLEKNHTLRRVLFGNAEHMPQTMEHLLTVAIAERNYDIVIQLGSCFPKKRILGILTSLGDPVLIDKFFFLYKEYPEIKRLAPFI